MRRLTVTALLALAAVAPLTAAPAAVAAKKAKPKITRVTPMRVSVGSLLTIRGRNFKPTRKGNTVIFRASNGRTAFAKPRRASRRKLIVRVPAAAARLLTVRNSSQRPTRLKLRVLAGRFSAYTSRRLSPVVTGLAAADGVDPPKACKDDADHDNDLLANDTELQVGLDPCLDDTDDDRMTDGWEFYAAKDLNVKAVPYPGKRPFPNALDPSDGGQGVGFSEWDFDGDGLTTLEEFRAWRRAGSSFVAAKVGGLDLESPLGYSDGTKFSRATETPGVPAWRSSSYGLSNPAQPFPATYQLFADAQWRDSERDADADGLANWLESSRGPSDNRWWASYWANDRQFNPAIEPWGEAFYCATTPTQSPGHFDERPFENLNLADSDVDGDTLLDGEDDQDNDGYTNIVEIYETQKDVDGNGQPAWCGYGAGVVPTITIGGDDWAVNAFNPCAPNPLSRTCDDFVPF